MATLLLDLDADSLGAVGSAVPSWTDATGSRAFTQASTGLQPAVVAGPNSHKAVQFTGDVLSNTASVTARPALTVSMVIRVDGAAAVARSGVLVSTTASSVNDYDGAGGNWSLQTPYDTAETTFESFLIGGAPTGTDARAKTVSNPYGAFVILLMTFSTDGAASKLYTNGTVDPVNSGGQDVADLTLARLNLGSRYYGTAADYGKFTLAKLRIHSGTMTQSERAAENTLLSDRYAIAVSDYTGSAGASGNPAGTAATPANSREQAVANIPNLYVWLRGDTALDKTVGSAITLWDDRSVNNYDATNVTAAERPTYTTTPKPGALFSGSRQLLLSGASASLTAETLFVVARPTSLSGLRALRGSATDGGSGGSLLHVDNGYPKISRQGLGDSLTGTNSISNNALSVITMDLSSSAARLFTNGSANGTAVNPTAPVSGQTTRVGASYNGGDNWVGTIYELISFSRVLSASERATVHSYLQDYYGSSQLTVSDYVTQGSTDTTAPTVPTNVTATATSTTSVTVSWTASTDAVGVASYLVRRGSTDLPTVGGSVTSYVDNTVSPGTAYSYTVLASDAAGNRSAASSPATVTTPAADTTAPTTPTNLVATANSATSVSLSWTASTDAVGVQSYRVRRNGSDLATAVTTTSYTDVATIEQVQYTYTVSAVDVAGNRSSESSSAVVTTPAAAGPLRVFDRWNGSALVRIKHERWTGTTLTTRLLEKYDLAAGVIVPAAPGTSTPARKQINFGGAPVVRATWETGINSDGKAQVTWVGSFPDMRARSTRLEAGVAAQAQNAYQAYVYDLSTNTTVVDSGVVTGTAEKWVATSFTPVAGRRYQGFARVRASDGQWSSYASTRFVAPSGRVLYLEDYGAVGDGVTQSGTDYRNAVYFGPIRNALKAAQPGDVVRSKNPGTVLGGLTASGATLSAPTAVFTQAMAGKKVIIYRAGTTDATTNSWAFRTTVSSVASDLKSVSLSVPVATAGTGLTAVVNYAEYVTGHIDVDNGLGTPGNAGGWTLDGTGCVFVSTDVDHAGFRTTVPDVTYRSVHYQQRTTTTRGNGKNGDTGPFFIESANAVGLRFIGCYAERARDAGFLIYDASSDIHIVDCVADHTNADGFHVTGSAHDIQFIRCDNAYIGDDAVANIGYRSDGDSKRPYNIVWEQPRVYGQDWGRGVSQGGCYNVLVTDLYIERGAGASFILGSDGDMANTADVQIRRFTIVNPNLRRGQKPTYSQGTGTSSTIPDEPWMKLLNSSSAVQQRDILLEDGIVTDGRFIQIISYGNGSFVDNTITLRGITMNGSVNAGGSWLDQSTYSGHIDLRGISVPSGSNPVTTAPTNSNS